MRTNDERIAEMHRRAAVIEREQRKQKAKILQTVTAAAGFAAVILMAVFVPKIVPDEITTGSDAGRMNASIFGGSTSISLIVIAVTAFLLGVFVTAFCFRLKKWQDMKNEDPGKEE